MRRRSTRRVRLNPVRPLEERVVPAANLFVTVGGTYPNYDQYLREYTPTGTLVSSVVIPTQGERAGRDLVVGADGRASVFNGMTNPILSTYNGTTWSNLTFNGFW